MANNQETHSQKANPNLFIALVAIGLVAALLLYWLAGIGYGMGTAVGVLLSLLIVNLLGQTRPETTPTNHQQQLAQLQATLVQREAQLTQTEAQLKETTQQLNQATEASEQDHIARNRFWRHISHELRTPLNGVINFSHMVSLGFYGDVTPRQINYLNRIEQSGWFLLTMLNDLSDLARIESGEFQLHLSPVELQAICEESLAALYSIITDEDVRIIRDYPEIWPEITADERRLKQLLVNLLRNAAKQVEEGYIALRVRHETPWLRLTIEDTGEGMTPEQQAALFPPLGENTTPLMLQEEKANFGLAVANYLITSHGGTLTIQSEPGRGSTLTILLPDQP
jgi:signal transduction histidine kinase